MLTNCRKKMEYVILTTGVQFKNLHSYSKGLIVLARVKGIKLINYGIDEDDMYYATFAMQTQFAQEKVFKKLFNKVGKHNFMEL